MFFANHEYPELVEEVSKYTNLVSLEKQLVSENLEGKISTNIKVYPQIIEALGRKYKNNPSITNWNNYGIYLALKSLNLGNKFRFRASNAFLIKEINIAESTLKKYAHNDAITNPFFKIVKIGKNLFYILNDEKEIMFNLGIPKVSNYQLRKIEHLREGVSFFLARSFVESSYQNKGNCGKKYLSYKMGFGSTTLLSGIKESEIRVFGTGRALTPSKTYSHQIKNNLYVPRSIPTIFHKTFEVEVTTQNKSLKAFNKELAQFIEERKQQFVPAFSQEEKEKFEAKIKKNFIAKLEVEYPTAIEEMKANPEELDEAFRQYRFADWRFYKKFRNANNKIVKISSNFIKVIRDNSYQVVKELSVKNLQTIMNVNVLDSFKEKIDPIKLSDSFHEGFEGQGLTKHKVQYLQAIVKFKENVREYMFGYKMKKNEFTIEERKNTYKGLKMFLAQHLEPKYMEEGSKNEPIQVSTEMQMKYNKVKQGEHQWSLQN